MRHPTTQIITFGLLPTQIATFLHPRTRFTTIRYPLTENSTFAYPTNGFTIIRHPRTRFTTIRHPTTENSTFRYPDNQTRLFSVWSRWPQKKRRLPRPRSRSPSSPFPTRHPQTQRALVRGGQTAAAPRSGRIERPAARGGAGEGGGGVLEQQLRTRRAREADRLCGAEKHRLDTNRTPIRI